MEKKLDTSHMTLFKTNAEIQEKILTLASKINKTYKDDETVIIGVLTGGFMFTSDLVKKIKIRCLIDFFGASSYENNQKTDSVKVTKKLKYEIQGKDVIIVEDMVDSGRSMNFIVEHFLECKPKSIKIFTLFGRTDTKYKLVNERIEFFWEYNNKDFFTGYGFDDHEYLRNLEDIYYINARH